ncbi:response regulator [Paenibacillus psychroresistens]|uniref:histidine kinase n=1 Tax=Paenibacillus psychroresistens TaxID=1778678 RepID=A0A6B8RKK8_9BACL|nr:ATP-binding protein [Paenibacillus psychroresistens]QGQ95956.1 response regulator [Paenibacillus psychroresistens]
MNSRKKIILILSIFMIVLALRIGFVVSSHQPKGISAMHGELDLREWEPDKDGIQSLNGEWEFYRNQLLPPEEISAQASSVMMNVPSKWNSYFQADHETAYGYGTYHLKVLLKPVNQQILALKITKIGTSNRIYVNGKEIGNSGKPASTKELTVAGITPYVAFAVIDGQAADIVIQVANFDHAISGGILQSIKLGSTEHIVAETRRDNLSNMFISSTYALLALAFLILFLFIRSKEVLSIGLCVLFTALFFVTQGGKMLLVVWFPTMDYTLYSRITSLAAAGLIYFYAQYNYQLNPALASRKIIRMLQGIVVIYGILSLFIDTAIFTLFSVPINFIFIAFHFYILGVLIKAVRLEKQDASLLLIGALGLFWQSIEFLFEFNDWNELEKSSKLGILIFVLSLTVLISIRVFRRFAETTRLAQQLVIMDKIKDEFLTNTSHELRIPLYGIINISQSMLDDRGNQFTASQLQNLNLLVTVGRRMGHLLNDILDMSKLNEAKIQLDKQYIDLYSLVNGLIEVMKFLVTGKELEVINQVPQDLAPIEADEQRLMQILSNLLYNAIKYTPKGRVVIQAVSKKDYMEIQVMDTGNGIPLEHQEEIFRGFVQGSWEEIDYQGGAGLGLSISKKLVELHGGRMGVRSIVGQGATFYFTIPITTSLIDLAASKSLIYNPYAAASLENTERIVLQTALPDTPSYIDYGGEMHILVVDNDPVNVHVILQLLGSEQYRITTMSRGEEVLAHLVQNKPEWDLVILDVMLPQMSGYEVCRKLREYYTLFELPIIMLTGQSQLGDLKAAFEAGANDYTVKPVNGEELKARIRTLLQMKRAVIDHIHLETALLQAQIKPHFLFNTLNTIASLGEEDSNQMRELLMEFGNYLRASFDSKNLNRFVHISHEMALVQSYLYIEKVRFAERLQFEILFPEDLEFRIPPLTLQPIIENAVRHGIMKRMEGGKIQISAIDLGDEVRVTVSDNGVGLTGDEIKAVLTGQISNGGIGLLNTHRRLKHYYGYGLTIESIPMQGTRVSMQIPKLK